jgi:pimeloyl-ACP methyl ester carboxylesterase
MLDGASAATWPDDGPIEPPIRSAAAFLREARVVAEASALLWRSPELLAQPRGDGRPVLVLPGFGAGDASTWVLRAYLRLLGWDARGWGLGTNAGDAAQLVPLVLERIASAVRAAGRPIHLVGWSMGGYLARESARERPADVARVVTLGTPVVGGPKYTAVGEVYRRRGVDLDALEASVAARNAVPLTTPVTAVFSRSDAVVAWRACIDRVNQHVDHVEVAGSHVGLGFNADVYRIVAQRLAAA